jgi:hypothetical protein
MGEISGQTDLSLQGSSTLDKITADLSAETITLDKALEDIGNFATKDLGLELSTQQLKLKIESINGNSVELDNTLRTLEQAQGLSIRI